MKSRIVSLLLIFVLPFGSAIGATDTSIIDAEIPPSGEAAARLMRGHWILSQRNPDMQAEIVSLVLGDDGRLTLDEVYKTKDGQLRITKTGKWWVEGGTCYGEFTKSSHPDIAPVGYTTKDTILKLDDRVMELRTREGGFERWERNIG